MQTQKEKPIIKLAEVKSYGPKEIALLVKEYPHLVESLLKIKDLINQRRS